MKRKESHDTLPSKISKPNYPSEEPTHEQVSITDDDDMIYEIQKWLSPFDLLCNCMLVNKQWMRVIKEKADLQFTFDGPQWSDFCSADRSMANRITSLSVKWLECNESTIKALKSMDALEKLSIIKATVEKELIEVILSNKSFKEFRINNSDFHGCDISPFKQAMPRVKVFLERCAFTYEDGYCDLVPLLSDCIPFLSGIDTDLVFGDSKREKQVITRFYKDLADCGNLSEWSIVLDDLSAEWLPSMKNLERLTIHESRLECDQLPNLSTLFKLRSITLYSPLTISDDEPGKSSLKALVGSLDKLTRLDFRFDLCREDLELISRAKNLSSLSCTGECNGLTISGMRLTELDTRDSVISREFVHALKDMVSLTKLTMSYTCIENSETPFTLADLCIYKDGIPECRLKLLRSLEIDPPPPQQKDAFKALSDMAQLKKLVLLRSVGSGELCGTEYLAQNKSITKLRSFRSEVNDQIVNELCNMAQLRDLFIETPSGATIIEPTSSMAHLKRFSIDKLTMF